MPRRRIELNGVYMCWIAILSLVSIGVYIFYLGATVGQFPAPRTPAEADVLFADYPAACSRVENYRFGLNWFWINSHVLIVLIFALLPILYIFALYTKQGGVLIFTYLVFSLLVVAFSVVGYIYIEAACRSYNNGLCGTQCIYEVADWSAPKVDGDITVTGRVSTAFTILRIVVPIMWVLAIISVATSIFAYADISRVFERGGDVALMDKGSGSDEPEEEQFARPADESIARRTRSAKQSTVRTPSPVTNRAELNDAIVGNNV